MDITLYRGHTPPANPDGITVVIDVIRAFTTAHEAFVGGFNIHRESSWAAPATSTWWPPRARRCN
ncbi:MAG: hypothetical protein ACPG43_11510 [Alcanivoracaceae bacterium]